MGAVSPHTQSPTLSDTAKTGGLTRILTRSNVLCLAPSEKSAARQSQEGAEVRVELPSGRPRGRREHLARSLQLCGQYPAPHSLRRSPTHERLRMCVLSRLTPHMRVDSSTNLHDD